MISITKVRVKALLCSTDLGASHPPPHREIRRETQDAVVHSHSIEAFTGPRTRRRPLSAYNMRHRWTLYCLEVAESGVHKPGELQYRTSTCCDHSLPTSSLSSSGAGVHRAGVLWQSQMTSSSLPPALTTHQGVPYFAVHRSQLHDSPISGVLRLDLPEHGDFTLPAVSKDIHHVTVNMSQLCKTPVPGWFYVPIHVLSPGKPLLCFAAL